MAKKNVLLVDDDGWFLEPLVDGLSYEGFGVETAGTVQDCLDLLSKAKFDLVTVDIMLDPGDSLKDTISTQTAGVFLCGEIKRLYPRLDVICISVVSDPDTIKPIKELGIKVLKKGETPLRTVLDSIRSKLTGIVYTTGWRNAQKRRQ